MYRYYGLTGKTINVKKKPTEETNPDPWVYGEQRMKILAEYPCYLLAEVLPHWNPKGQDISKPYRTCLHKNDIQIGEVIINGGAVR